MECVYVWVLVECIREAKVASVKLRTELCHNILDSADIGRVNFKFPFSDSFKLNGYKGSWEAVCTHRSWLWENRCRAGSINSIWYTSCLNPTVLFLDVIYGLLWLPVLDSKTESLTRLPQELAAVLWALRWVWVGSWLWKGAQNGLCGDPVSRLWLWGWQLLGPVYTQKSTCRAALLANLGLQKHSPCFFRTSAFLYFPLWLDACFRSVTRNAGNARVIRLRLECSHVGDYLEVLT